MKTNQLALACLFVLCMPMILFAQSVGLPPAAVHAVPGPSVGRLANADGGVQATSGRDQAVLDSASYASSFTGTGTCQGLEVGERAINFADLRFMGFPIRATAVSCRPGSQNMSRPCGRQQAINPANPQYGANIPGGDLNRNPTGVYFCVDGVPGGGGFKYNICVNEAPVRYRAQGYEFRWQGPRGGDGNCLCKKPGDTEFSLNCQNNQEQLVNTSDDEIIVTAQVCRRIGLPAYDPDPFPDDLTGTHCKCSAEGSEFFPYDSAREQCERVRAARVAIDSGAADAAVRELQVRTDSFRDCVNSWKQLADSCKVSSEQAGVSCNPQNNTNSDAANAMASLGQSVVGTNAGQGTQSTCFNASAMTYAARQLLSNQNNDCKIERTTCTRTCTADSYNNFVNECSQRAKLSAADLQTDTTAIGDLFRSESAGIQTAFQEGTARCAATARAQSDMDEVINGSGQAMRAAAICACQTSSTSNQNCQAIPDIAVCEAGSTSGNCAVYDSISTCAVGTPGYNARTCACAQNPSDPTCRTTNAGKVAANAFAGLSPVMPTASGGTNGFAGGGGQQASAGNFDLNAKGGAEGSNNSLASNLKAGDTGGTAPNAMGGSVSAGGSGGGDANTATAPLAELDGEEKGLKGMFNQIKNSVMGALGVGGSQRAPKTAAPSKSNEDMSRFKPNIRGAGVNRGVASANEKTLFELVNECANGIRCKSTVNSFLIGP